MTCEPFRDQLTAYHLGDLDAATAEAVRAHVENCRHCQASLREIATTLDLLQDALAGTVPAAGRGLTAASRKRILESARPLVEAGGSPGAWKRWLFTAHPRLAYAAGITLMLGLVWLLLPHANTPSEQVPRVASLADRQDSPVADADAVAVIPESEEKLDVSASVAAVPPSVAARKAEAKFPNESADGKRQAAPGGAGGDFAAMTAAPAPAPMVAAETEIAAERLGRADATEDNVVDARQGRRNAVPAIRSKAQVLPSAPPLPEVLQRLQETVIDEVDFRQAPLRDVAAFLEDKANASIVGEKDAVGITITLDPSLQAAAAPAGSVAAAFTGGEVPEGAHNLITFRAHDIRALEALRIASDVVNTRFQVDGNEIRLVPYPAPDGPIVHRRYHLAPDVVSEIMVQRFGADGASKAANIPRAADVLKTFFSDVGVNWPVGSTVSYDEATGELRIASDVPTLEALERQLDRAAGLRDESPQHVPP